MMDGEEAADWYAKLENPVPGYGVRRDQSINGDDEIAQLNNL